MSYLLLRFGLLVASVPPALAGCAYGTFIQPRPEDQILVDSFGYIGRNGPIDWMSLDPEANILCGTGTRQSPINLAGGTFEVVPGESLNIDIPDMVDGATFENLGTTVEVIAQGGSMTVNGVEGFQLKQFHFHLPSEHLDNGTSLAMEMHMVWEGPESSVAVIGVFVDIDEMLPMAPGETVDSVEPEFSVLPVDGVLPRNVPAEEPKARRMSRRQSRNPDSVLLQAVFGSINQITQPGSSTTTQPLIMSELVDMLAAGQFQTYSGSFTTPPCTEGVTWLVSNQKLIVTPATFEAVRTIIGFNSRFPQNELGEPNLLRLAAVPSPEADAAQAKPASTYRPIPAPP